MAAITLATTPPYRWWVRLLLRSQRRKFGAPLEPVMFWGRIPRILFGFFWMFFAFKRARSPIAPALQALIRVRVSQLLHCPFCIDMNMSEAYAVGLSHVKMEALAEYPTNALYDAKERLILDYATAVVRSDQAGCTRLLNQLGHFFVSDALIELTALITHQAMSALFNAALGITPHGFCKIGPTTA